LWSETRTSAAVRGPAGTREGVREGGREGRREGVREGRREGRREGKREGREEKGRGQCNQYVLSPIVAFVPLSFFSLPLSLIPSLPLPTLTYQSL